ncbi:iron-containing alcohol dehydrogenase [Fundicoccus culcitae]|uniref:Iron-containing alcohol dehydrogenase n=1 Tax=Fundicoccus culcitae TaxID=2969821 RepID=A0ABY5P4R2_9LACT|nr:iron-containing alcohol dehydrogenase [Fundicoccus culcitae]UUX33539.1 iron-containing alcohol dehydrogenase [Fundicoccus culcitae]
MKNFVYNIPTKLYFGKDQIKNLPDLLNLFGKRVLLTYGGGSVKRSGLYNTIIELLADYEIVELANIEVNPRVDSVRQGATLCKEHQIDVILAVGGGSVIDASKMIAAASKYDGDAWDLVKHPKRIEEVLPLIDILTLSATGSEMNASAVISNTITKEKLNVYNKKLYPHASICDPTYTFSVPKNQTAAGTADIMAHTIETYFSIEDDVYIQDKLCESILKTCIHYLPMVLQEPENYDARANLMWASTLAQNGIISFGKGGPWSSHHIEHILSAYYDIPHAVGMAILIPRWMNYVLNQNTVKQFAVYAENVWGITQQSDIFKTARLGIRETYEFFSNSGLPLTLPEVGVKSNEHFSEIAELASPYLTKSYISLSKDDIIRILESCMNPFYN